MKTIRTAAVFERRSKKILKKNPDLENTFSETIRKLLDNPFDPTLHTHPLAGNLKGKYACSLTRDLRIVFKLYDNIYISSISAHMTRSINPQANNFAGSSLQLEPLFNNIKNGAIILLFSVCL